MDIGLSPIKEYKVFFVEVDDEDRERVLECRVDNIRVRMDQDHHDILSDYSTVPVARYMASSTYSIEEMTLLPMDERGTVMRIRDFSKEDE